MHYKKIGRQNMSNISAADFPRKQSNNSQSLLFEHWKWFAAAMTVVEPSAFSSDFPSFSIFFQSFWNHLNENDRRESKPPGNWGVDPHDGHEAFAFDSEIVRFQLCRCPDILRAFYTLTWQHCSKKRKMYSSKLCYNDKKGLRYFLGKTKWTTREKKMDWSEVRNGHCRAAETDGTDRMQISASVFSVFVDDKTAADAFVKYLGVSRTKL